MHISGKAEDHGTSLGMSRACSEKSYLREPRAVIKQLLYHERPRIQMSCNRGNKEIQSTISSCILLLQLEDPPLAAQRITPQVWQYLSFLRVVYRAQSLVKRGLPNQLGFLANLKLTVFVRTGFSFRPELPEHCLCARVPARAPAGRPTGAHNQLHVSVWHLGGEVVFAISLLVPLFIQCKDTSLNRKWV